MSLFDALPVGLPQTVHDWTAFSEQLCCASNDELTWRTDKRGQESARETIKKFNETFGGNDDGAVK
jgi:hypothetical protein